MDDTRLIGAAIAGMALVLFLILRVKLHAFVALLLGSLVIGIGAGMRVDSVLESVTTGVGSTLASIAVVIGLGAMFGRMLEASGGAEAIAASVLARAGERNAQWAMVAVGFVVAIPVFFDVAFIVLISMVYGLVEKTGRPLMYYAVPLMAGLVVTHSFIPPTPGPIAVAVFFDVDLGWVMLFGALIGIPAAIVAGPVWGKFIATRVPAGIPDYMHVEKRRSGSTMPPAWLVMLLIGLPLVLIVGNTVTGELLADGEAETFRTVFALIGHPITALLITTVLCFWLLGTRAGYSRDDVQELATGALAPAGIVILVTGAGGVLKQVLIDSGVGDALSMLLIATDLPALLLAFIIAATLRLMQGSATVAMLTAGALVSTLFVDPDLPQPMLALYVIAIAAGATIASHVNDSGFWLVNRYLGLTVLETMKTWTALTTIVSLVSIVLVLIAAAIIG